VDAAVAAQRELELPVRMGRATGEAELRDSYYFGGVLNRAARVMAAGHGGQILLAESQRSRTNLLCARLGQATVHR
jgi:class 3 adenylate cyclase